MDTQAAAGTFGHYQLLELLGKGGMGEVYRAHDTQTDRVVALKVLPPHMAQDEVFQRRFRREAHAAAGVSDPHVVPIHGYGEIDGRLYLDMQLIEGMNLGAILAQRDKPLGSELAVAVVEQVGSALDAAHQVGLVHRDVKPSNIVISEREFVYLIDFGLARTMTEPGMTTVGSTLGTLAYMAPERFNGGPSDPRSDIYALACVLYECLTGSRPYPSDSLEQQIAGHMVNPPPRPSDFDPALAAFDPVIAKGMAKEPAHRYQTAAALAAAATSALQTPKVRPTRQAARKSAHRAVPEPKLPKRRVFIAAAVGLVVASTCVFGAWKWRNASDEPTQSAAVTATTESIEPNAVQGALPDIAATVPADIRDTGRLIVGVNVPYAPNEFRDSYGQLVGFDVDLMNAVARTLGLQVDYRETAFESIIPSVHTGSFNVGMSSVTDTKAREQQVDFVTYFQAGTMWVQRTGGQVDPNNACGLRVGVAYGVIQETEEIPAKSQACVAAGLPAIDKVVFTRQDDVTSALVAGNLDAMSADSPVAGFAVKTSGGELEPAGEVFDAAPYGWPVPKGSGLADALRLALEHLMSTGEYRTIATMWGVERGMIEAPVINGAVR